MPYPKIEELRELVGDGVYVEDAQWRVFEDLDGELPGRNVLLVLGGSWTILSAETFKQMAERVLPQL